RSHSHNSPKDHAEVALIAKSGVQANVGDRSSCISKKILRLGYSKSIEILDKRFPGAFLEKAHEATGACGAFPAHIRYSNRFVIMLLYVLEGRLQPRYDIALPIERRRRDPVLRTMVDERQKNHLQIRSDRKAGVDGFDGQRLPNFFAELLNLPGKARVGTDDVGNRRA